jgi:hypothetical protein
MQIIPAEREPTTITSEHWQLDWMSDLNTMPEGWFARVMEPYGDSKEYTTENNVWTYGGFAVVSLDRHCLAKNGKEKITVENQTTGVCPDGTKTAYASGRLETQPVLSGDYRVDVNVRLSDAAVKGWRLAVWEKDLIQYCNGPASPVREHDVELYSARPDLATATNYVYCDHGKLNSSHHSLKLKKDWVRGEHTLSIQVEDQRITSFIDNEPIPINGSDEVTDSVDTFPDATSEQYSETFKYPAQLIIQMEAMTGSENPAFRAPRDDKPFPVQKVMINDVKVYKKVSTTLVLP